MLVFVESPLFSNRVFDYLDDAEYAKLQVALLDRPDAGVLIPKSGGIRKLRWAGKGKGKRGGLRVIYYWQKAEDEVWMLTLYAKNEEQSIPVRSLRAILAEFME
jgi:mRNA-degrading endonuclease RelE of RelBE toxin-antitoxin system